MRATTAVAKGRPVSYKATAQVANKEGSPLVRQKPIRLYTTREAVPKGILSCFRSARAGFPPSVEVATPP